MQQLIRCDIHNVGTVVIAGISMEGDHNPKAVLREKDKLLTSISSARLSNDGRWMAYTSVESGKAEIYVRPFPDVNRGKWQVSSDGGENPLWSLDGRELFYRNGDSVIAVAVQAEPAFIAKKPEVLFQGKYDPSWDISHDGKRFLMIKKVVSTTDVGPRKINIVLNWFEKLKQRVPTK